MSTQAPTAENGTEELPPNWMQTDHRRYARTDAEVGIIRITTELPVIDAEAFNTARHVEGQGDIVVLFYDAELPSEPEEIYRGGDLEAARAAAREKMEAEA